MDNLLDVLNEEESQYRELINLSNEKKDVLIKADIERLQQITEAEQNITDDLHNLEAKRRSIISDMAVVLRRDEGELTVEKMIEILDKQPEEKEKLAEVRKRLRETLDEMIRVNTQNQILIKQAMEMVEFDLTLFRSMRQAPETANYGRDAESTGDLLGRSGFDAKQ
ncbi:MAG: flagellar protein FlgN [Lachnospiraceae bacterium]|nr:flagellar protein FlgN [Lachnospiraceae bacterium]